MDEMRSRVSLAAHFLDIGRPADALRSLEEGPGPMAESPEFWRVRCAALRELKDYEGAVEAAKEGLRRHPDDSELLHRRSLAEARMWHLAAAERSMLACLEQDPDDPTHLSSYAILLLQGAQVDAAARVLDRALELAPDNLCAGYAHLLYCLIHHEGKHAEAAARNFIERHPENPLGHLMLSLTAENNGDTAQAVVALKEAYRLNPELSFDGSALRILESQRSLNSWPLYLIKRVGVLWILLFQVAFLLLLVWTGSGGFVLLFLAGWVGLWAASVVALVRINRSTRRVEV